MKRFCVLALLGFAALQITARPAHAIKFFMDTFQANYLKDNGDRHFVTDVQEAKCFVCHYGKSKKQRNDYGTALSKILDRTKYKSSRIKEEPEKAQQEVKSAMKKVGEQKSVSGKPFIDLIKAGKLPGTPPADAG